MGHRIKLPDVGGVFYPREPDALAGLLDGVLAGAPADPVSPKAVIVPHAGYRFSGEIAARGWSRLARRRGEIRRVVLFGPAHRSAFDGMAVLGVTHWETPLGRLVTDAEAMATALRCPDVQAIDAPFLREHSLEVQLPFVQRALGDVTVLPVLVGRAQAASVARLMDALWGGPETAIVVSSDLSHYHDYDTASALDAGTTSMIERAAPDRIGSREACGHLAVRALIGHARLRDLRITALDVRNSGDIVGERSRVVGYGTYAFEYAQSARLPDEARERLLEAARASLREGPPGGPGGPVTAVPAAAAALTDSPLLRAQRNTFVTLEIDGRLRGCIGSVRPQRSLAEDVCVNARKAAYADPRFAPLAADEIDRLQVSVSVLSHPRPIEADSEERLLEQLRPDADGLILADGERSALFLPSVWRSLPDPRAFVRQLRRKAGLPEQGWTSTMRATRFGAEYFGARAG
jgi:AmmeMemoRadiSam system protein B/AmmeMemoRadiSam system protein A